MPLAEDGRICLLRQFRPPLGDWLWELPAGKIDAGEDPLETARRELAEEAGLLARRWQSLGDLVACPGFSDEILHLFLATELQVVPTRRDEDEHIETHWVPYAEARAWARAGRIRDAKTVAALFRAGEEAG
jgi:ADP-ribose pyrophosphatase